MKSEIDTYKEIIDSFPEPENDFDRVDFNIQCNRMAKGEPKHWFAINAISMLAIPIFFLLYCINRLFAVRNNEITGSILIIESTNRKGAKYNFDGRVPTFIGSNNSVHILDTGVFPKFREGMIGRKALSLFCKFVARHPFDFFNNFRMFVNLMGYNRLLYVYKPSAIANTRMELNHNSSLISLLCEGFDCKFINIMHGEVLYNIETAFVRFSEFYIWDEHYINVFEWSRSPINQFLTYKPDIFNITVDAVVMPEYYLTYIFLGDEKEGFDKNAYDIKTILQVFEEHGMKCKVRPHPRWSDLEQLKQIFDNTGILVEDPKNIGIEESLSSTKKVVGTYSTVMSEAFYANKEIVIDDVSDAEMYESLFKRGYILLSKPHELLSEIIPK